MQAIAMADADEDINPEELQLAAEEQEDSQIVSAGSASGQQQQMKKRTSSVVDVAGASANAKAAKVTPTPVPVPQTTSATATLQAAAPVHSPQHRAMSVAGEKQSSARGRTKMSSAVPQAQMEGEVVKRSTWPHTQTFLADVYCSQADDAYMKAPSAYTKDVQRAKWAAEITKVKPFIVIIERVLSQDYKWKDNEVKNALKAFGKINAKTDKKLDYDSAKASDSEPTLSQRISVFKELLDSVRALKDLAITSGKSGSIAKDTLKSDIEKIHTTAQKLIPDKIIGFPFLWVQVGYVVCVIDG